MSKLDKNNEYLKYIPEKFRICLDKLSEYSLGNFNEISFISGQAVTIKIRGKRSYLGKSGITYDSQKAVISGKNDLREIYNLITESSPYAYNRFVNEGFLTLKGGHRVGITGNFILNEGKIVGVNTINTLCFRISHHIKVDCSLIFEEIHDCKSIKNTIIISPPGCGKTTLLRNLIAYLTTKDAGYGIVKCALIDERYEIASCYEGEATMNVGNVTSVISGCNKENAIPIVVRSISPDIIAVDELASKEDILAVKYAQASGCSVIATTHGYDEENNKLTYYNYKDMFDNIIILSARNGPGTIEKIIKGERICL